jgi:hypothetical protein
MYPAGNRRYCRTWAEPERQPRGFCKIVCFCPFFSKNRAFLPNFAAFLARRVVLPAANAPFLNVFGVNQFRNDTYQFGDDTYQFRDDTYQFGNDTYQFGNDTYQFRNDTYQFGDDTYQFGDDTYQFGDDTYQFGNDTYQFRDDTYQFGDDTYQFGNDTYHLSINDSFLPGLPWRSALEPVQNLFRAYLKS